MAGTYPDVPAPRMAYDRDGTVMMELSSSYLYIQTYSQAVKESLNSERNGGVSNVACFAFIFPEQRDISGYLVTHTNGGSRLFQSSNDTTNGEDGTWTTEFNYTQSGSSTVSQRNEIQTASVTNVKAIRFQTGNGGWDWGYLHLYGRISSAGGDRLRMWHPTLDEPLDDNNSTDASHLDWGDITQGTTEDRTFRIKNNSATLTANSIIISNEVLSNTSPALESQVSYSNGGAFTDSLNIGNLGPGTISPIITVRRSTSLNASLAIWTMRTVAEAGSWT